MRIAILQSNYIPWKGYFDLIRSVDEFVLFDDVQYTRRDWRNRNRIKTAAGPAWLTIPVQTQAASTSSPIKDIVVSDRAWAAPALADARRQLRAGAALPDLRRAVRAPLPRLHARRG